MLDLGCGSGRDLRELSRRGYEVVGLDYSRALAAIASKLSKQRVIVTRIEDMDFHREFDAIWAVASLLHVRREDIDRVLQAIARAIRPRGHLLTSMQVGAGSEVSADGRLFEMYTSDEWEARLHHAGFQMLECIDTPSRGTRDVPIKWMAHVSYLKPGGVSNH
ncbi:MAG: class I SAM-dependent methyltransferase [Planctomycetes bacterium]|nr:class I SAM-dependent methyltransferase [Planctomycetota bacterium]